MGKRKNIETIIMKLKSWIKNVLYFAINTLLSILTLNKEHMNEHYGWLKLYFKRKVIRNLIFGDKKCE